MENDRHIDEKLRRALDGLEVQPGIAVFDAIMKKVEKKKKRRLLIRFFGLGLALFSGAGLFLINLKNDDHKKATDTAGVKIQTQRETGAGKNATGNAFKSYNNRIVKKGVAPGIGQQEQLNAQLVRVKQRKAKVQSPAQALARTKGKPAEKDSPQGLPESDAFSVTSNTVRTPLANTSPGGTTPTVENNLYDEAPVTLSNAAAANPLNPAMVQDVEDTITFLQLGSIQTLIRDTLKEPPVKFPYAAAGIGLPDSLHPKRRVRFYAGANYNAQYSKYVLSKNPRMDPAYNSGGSFASTYLGERKKQNVFSYNYAYGLKLGLNFYDKYELFVGFGFQHYNYSNPPVTTTFYGVYPQQNAYGSGVSYDLSILKYRYYSAEANRIYRLNRLLKAKIGLGLRANQLLYSNYLLVKAPNNFDYREASTDGLAHWVYTLNLKAGLIFDLGRRLQLHVSPAVFYSPNSMFNRSYVFRQKSVGFELEGLLLFKIF